MVTPDKTKFCSAALQSQGGVRHGFFTRAGGVSEGLYASLNCGPGSADAPAGVAENRALVAQHLGAHNADVVTLYQVHGAAALSVSAPVSGADRPRPTPWWRRRPGSPSAC